MDQGYGSLTTGEKAAIIVILKKSTSKPPSRKGKVKSDSNLRGFLFLFKK
jgi:hypothetical protein